MAEVKNYGLSGVHRTLQLGKQGPVLVGNADTDSFTVTLQDGATLTNMSGANATSGTHFITKSQLDAVYTEAQFLSNVNYNDSSPIAMGTISSGTKTVITTFEVTSAFNANAVVTVGTGDDNSLLMSDNYAEIEVPGTYQTINVVEFTSNTTLNIYVTQGGATQGAGTVLVSVVDGPVVNGTVVSGGGGSGGIALTDLSVSTASPSGNGSLSYNNSTGVFTFTPADASGAGGGSSTSLTHLELTNDGFIGAAVNFVKTNYGSEVDNIDTDVAITRGNQQGIYNPLVDGGWNSNDTPSNTEWNAEGWDDLSDVTSRTYTNFYDAVNGNLGNNIIGLKLVMHDTVNDKYYTFIFTQWTQGGNGGGFAYTRQQIDVANPYTGITFPDGTKQTTAYTGNTTKTWTNPNDNVWRIEEYSGGVAVAYDYPSANISYTFVTSETNSSEFSINVNDSPNEWVAVQNANYVVFNGTTYRIGGYSGDGTNYRVFIGLTDFSGGANITYTTSDSLTINYRDQTQPLVAPVWWDAANSPGGSSNFRGAIIEYHAYCGDSGTVVGKIIMANDDERTVTHMEASSGSNSLAQYEFWVTDGDGRLAVRRVGDDANNSDDEIWIQWTSKIFYGSEYYC